MRTRFVEAAQTETGPNWGKFMVGLFDNEEWNHPSTVDPQRSVIGGRGWTRYHIHVLDLQTGEGALFRPGGSAKADLDKHAIWCCPMFEPFLTWLYEFIQQEDAKEEAFGRVMNVWFDRLPPLVLIPDAEFAMSGYRRGGPE